MSILKNKISELIALDALGQKEIAESNLDNETKSGLSQHSLMMTTLIQNAALKENASTCYLSSMVCLTTANLLEISFFYYKEAHVLRKIVDILYLLLEGDDVKIPIFDFYLATYPPGTSVTSMPPNVVSLDVWKEKQEKEKQEKEKQKDLEPVEDI